jgi:hypothetical protein
MTESLHKILTKHVSPDKADKLCQEFSDWLMRNYAIYKWRGAIEHICNKIQEDTGEF